MNQKIGIAVDTEKDNALPVTNITSDGLVISFREQAADSLSGYSSIKIEISSTRSSTQSGRSVAAVSKISL